MVISIFKFLSRYYGIFLDTFFECSHAELKKNFTFLERCSLEYASNNVDMIKSGKIIYVRDTNGEICPYIAPEKVNSSSECLNCNSNTYKEEEEIFVIDELCDLPTYKLKRLLSLYKRRPSFYRLIKSELMSRGVYKVKRFKVIREIVEIDLEESEFYDKYKRRREIKYKKS